MKRAIAGFGLIAVSWLAASACTGGPPRAPADVASTPDGGAGGDAPVDQTSHEAGTDVVGSGQCALADAGRSCDADVTSDPNNCGVCGHNCLGAGCVAGLCQAAPFLSGVGFEGVWSLAVDDAHVIWVSRSTSGPAPIPVVECATKLAPVLPPSNSSCEPLGSAGWLPGPLISVPSVTGGVSKVYWDQQGDPALSEPAPGLLGVVGVSGTGYTQYRQFVANSQGLLGGVIFGSGTGQAPLSLNWQPASGTAHALPSGLPVATFALAADEQNLYWLEAQQLTGPGATLSAALMELPTAGSQPIELAAADVSWNQLSGFQAIGPIASDGAYVYWSSCGFNNGAGTLWRVAVGGGPLETVWHGTDCLVSIVIDASYVYGGAGTCTGSATSESCSLRIDQIPKGGGAATQIASWSTTVDYQQDPYNGVPVLLAQDATTLYFAGGTEQTIWRLAKPGGTCTGGQCVCPANQIQCGAVSCTDNQTDVENCGCCGVACSGGTCSGGHCSCAAPAMLCNGACADLTTDPKNCGSCGTACPSGAACAAGHCCSPGTVGEILCGGACVDVMNDSNNCSACGMTCASGECSNATCCAAGTTACPHNGGCHNLQTDPLNCGTCGNACPSAASCVAGTCVCPNARTACPTACVDEQTDAHNCGGCGVVCAAGMSCVNGACGCEPGQTLCAGVCADEQTDTGNCGACGMACDTRATCSSGVCTCPTGGNDWNGSAICASIHCGAGYACITATSSTFPAGLYPIAIAVDGSGNAWVANGSSSVTEIGADGATLGTFTVGVNPQAVAVDPGGNIWVASYSQPNNVTELNSSGATLGTFSVSGSPYAIAIDPSGNVWVVPYGNGVVYKLSPTGAMLGTFTVGTDPWAIAIDRSGNAWVANFGSNNVTELSPSGATLGTFAVGGSPIAIAVDPSGNLWVNAGLGGVIKLSPTGATLGSFTAGNGPNAITVDPTGNIWVADAGGNDVTEMSSSGITLGTFPAGTRPKAIASDAHGNVWVANFGSNNVTELTP